MVITPYRGWFDLNLYEIWRYRDLLWIFVKRDFTTFYKQTILGPIWFFIQPLISTIVFMKYQEFKEQNKNTNFKMIDFFKNNKTNIFKIFVYNGLMLLCGFLGEAGIIDKRLGIPVGFIFFYLSFNLIYQEYAKKSELGKKLFTFLVVIWGLYGVAAMTDLKTKNISYNILDIIAKNFYGLFIYYKILQISR